MRLIDTHAHLNLIPEPQLAPVIDRALNAGVDGIVVVGIDLASSAKAIRLAASHPGIYATVGVHPHEADQVDEDLLDQLSRLAGDKNVVAIGEIGLDYYRDRSPRQAQREAFRFQIELAGRLEKPIIVHDREAHDDIAMILEEYPSARVLMHCFSGDADFARLCQERGYLIAVAGPITFDNADKLRHAVADVPLEQLVIETDCPYLTPHPWRGRQNEPSYLPLINESLAKVKKVTAEEMAIVTSANAEKFLSLER